MLTFFKQALGETGGERRRARSMTAGFCPLAVLALRPFPFQNLDCKAAFIVVQ